MADIDLQALFDGLDYRELRAVQRRGDWCRQEEQLEESDLRSYLHRATATALAEGSISGAELVGFIREEIVSQGPHTPETQIKRVLQETRIPGAVRQMSQREIFLCGQLYGALRGVLGEDYIVDQEYGVESNRRLDLYIKHQPSGDEFLVEAKIADHLDRKMIKPDVSHRVELYQDQLEQHAKSFVLMFFFDDRYCRLQRQGERVDLDDFWKGAKLEMVESISNCETVVRVLDSDWK